MSVSDRDSPSITFRSGTQRARTDLQIRRYPRGRPGSFRSVRDLGRVPAHRSCRSVVTLGCSARWLPAWLPAGSHQFHPRVGDLRSRVTVDFRRSVCLYSFGGLCQTPLRDIPLAATRPGSAPYSRSSDRGVVSERPRSRTECRLLARTPVPRSKRPRTSRLARSS
jgi:hypothetical protein